MYMKETGIVTKEEQSEMDQVFDMAIIKTIEDTVEVCQPKAVSSEEVRVIGFFLDALFTPESPYITRFYHTPKEVRKEFKNKEKDYLLNELGLILDADKNMKEWGELYVK